MDLSSTLSPRPETCPRFFSLFLPQLKLFLLHPLSYRTVGPPAGAPGLRSQPQRSSPVSPSTVTSRIFVLKCKSDMQPPCIKLFRAFPSPQDKVEALAPGTWGPLSSGPCDVILLSLPTQAPPSASWCLYISPVKPPTLCSPVPHPALPLRSWCVYIVIADSKHL